MKINLGLIIVLFFSLASIQAQDPSFVEENYDKAEYQVEMRDGVNCLPSFILQKINPKPILS